MYTQDKNGIYISGEKINLSYPEDGNDFFKDLEEKSFWFTHRNEIIRTVLNKHPFQNNFADIGGGNGFQVDYLRKQFKEREFYLIEPSYLGCANAKKRGIENVYCMDFSAFPMEEKKIGGLGLFDVIEHIEDDVSFLQSLRNSSPIDSVLYLTTPSYKNLWSDVDEFSGHFKRYTAETLSETFVKAGWTVAYTTYFFTFLPPLVWTMRRLPYLIRGARPYDKIREKEAENHQGSFFEKALQFIHGKEPATINKSKIGFGSSVFGVAVNRG